MRHIEVAIENPTLDDEVKITEALRAVYGQDTVVNVVETILQVCDVCGKVIDE